MSAHEDEASLLRAALPQYLELAEIGIKADLGYPAGALLFVVVDTIDGFTNKSKQGFAVLKSPYFGLASLTDEQLDNLYELGRCALVHSAIVGRVLWLRGEDRTDPFEFAADGTIQVYLPAFLRLCKIAVETFLANAPAIIPESKVVQNQRKKEIAYSVKSPAIAIDPTGLAQSAQASGVMRKE